MNPQSFNNPPQNPSSAVEKPLDIKKQEYLDLLNDFGFFITLNTVALQHQIVPGKEAELQELREALRKPIINGLSYTDFIFKNPTALTRPDVSQVLIAQIYNFLLYIEPRLSIFRPDTDWPKRFKVVKDRYTKLVTPLS